MHDRFAIAQHTFTHRLNTWEISILILLFTLVVLEAAAFGNASLITPGQIWPMTVCTFWQLFEFYEFAEIGFPPKAKVDKNASGASPRFDFDRMQIRLVLELKKEQQCEQQRQLSTSPQNNTISYRNVIIAPIFHMQRYLCIRDTAAATSGSAPSFNAAFHGS